MSRPAITRSVMDKRPRITPTPQCDHPTGPPAPASLAPTPRVPTATPLMPLPPYRYKPSRNPLAEQVAVGDVYMQQHRRNLQRGYFDRVKPEEGAQMVEEGDEAAAAIQRQEGNDQYRGTDRTDGLTSCCGQEEPTVRSEQPSPKLNCRRMSWPIAGSCKAAVKMIRTRRYGATRERTSAERTYKPSPHENVVPISFPPPSPPPNLSRRSRSATNWHALWCPHDDVLEQAHQPPAISVLYAPRQPTQPKPQPAHWSGVVPPITPGLRWECSPYPRTSLPDVSTPPANCDLLSHRNFSTSGSPQPLDPPCPRPRSIALPAQIPGIIAVTLNPALRFGAGIDVDFIALESLAKLGAGLLGETATFPGLPSLTLVSPYLPWVITAHASNRWVVVGDILSAIGQALHMRIVEGELEEGYEEMAKDRRTGLRGSNEITEGRRMTKSHNQKTWAETRLRLLGGRTRFGGLVESVMGLSPEFNFRWAPCLAICTWEKHMLSVRVDRALTGLGTKTQMYNINGMEVGSRSRSIHKRWNTGH
ncbi:hypothetical protein B0H16DRAFT_1684923 [Mycena metata]|uniref:DUF6699 domain-containing protein n=1 Tax=Mycena metata TaxID=1033252 RepID=A0AAD7K001_9AGAR|nr:hypothetical protein B0H16DRAFT_1684923 [Mycena metata]